MKQRIAFITLFYVSLSHCAVQAPRPQRVSQPSRFVCFKSSQPSLLTTLFSHCLIGIQRYHLVGPRSPEPQQERKQAT